MSAEVFNKQLDWAESRGLFLHENIERKANDIGVYGMYATAPIKAYTLLASFPTNELLVSKQKPFKEQTESVGLNWIHAAAKELSKPQSKYDGIFAGFERLEDMETYSSYFCSENELKLLQFMHPMLLRWVVEAKRKADATIEKIHSHDPSIDRKLLLKIYLNYRSRAFHPEGIVPVLDQFNHSDALGQPNTVENGKLCVYAKQDCQPGEQLFISYGPKDLYAHAIHYNYFDPGGPHLIEFGRKNIQAVQNQESAALLSHLKKLFKVKEFDNRGTKAFFVSDPSVMIAEGAPTQGLAAYLRESCRVRVPSASDQELMRHAAEYLVFLIDRQLQMNKVHQVKEESVPSRLSRFYYLLKKEQQMLLMCRAKVTGQTPANAPTPP